MPFRSTLLLHPRLSTAAVMVAAASVLGGCSGHDAKGNASRGTTSSRPAPAPPAHAAATDTKPDTGNTGPGAVALRSLDGLPAQTLGARYASPPECARWDGHQLKTLTDGCTVRNVSYTGHFVVSNNDTTLLDDRITGGGTEDSNDIVVSSNWGSGDYTGTLIEDSEISGSAGGSLYCVAGFAFTLVRDDVSGCSHLINLYGQPDQVTIESSFLHSPKAATGDHVELLYASPGASNIRIAGDDWYMTPVGSPTAALFLDGFNADSRWTIVGNWFDGQNPTSSNWNSIQADTSGITFAGNRIGVNSTYGPYLFNQYPPTASAGNVWMYTARTPTSWPGGSSEVVAGQEVPGI